MLIAHPPCTYLTRAGSNWLFNKDHTIRDYRRLAAGCDGRELFMAFLNASVPRICVENPTPMKFWQLPEPTQAIEPYMFGEPWRKRTLLWLKNLPKLEPTDIVEPTGLWCGVTHSKTKKWILNTNKSGKVRSKTFAGIAEAMAEQWG